MKETFILIFIGALGTVTKGLVQGLENLEITGRVDRIIEIEQNTEKSLGDLKRFVVTQTPVRNHRLTLV